MRYISSSYYRYFKTVLLAAGCITLGSQCRSKSGTATVSESTQTQILDEYTVTLTDAQLRNSPVETAVLSERAVASVLKLNGKIDVPPQNLVSVSIPLGGYLKSTQLLPGMHVRKGQVIATMEDPQYIQLQQDYLQARSRLQYADQDYQRQKTLNQSQASSDKVLQLAQTERNNQRILMQALAEQLRLIHINPEQLHSGHISKSIPVYSSIDGYVSKVNVNIGKYVTPSDVLFELINPSDIHLNLKVYEQNVGQLSIGQKVIAYTNAHPDRHYTGAIILISKDVGTSGITDVHCHFDEYDPELIPGMYMNAIIETQSLLSYTLPEESIVSYEGQDFVFVRTGKQSYRLSPVEPGDTENGYVQIRNHDQLEGKEIVTRNAYTLLMALKNTNEEE